MSQLDVRQLSDNESLAELPFPSTGRSEYRVHLAPEVHQGVAEHAAVDTSVEICGVLVGRWQKDSDGPYALVTNHIRCESATSKFAEVTFTHESWAQINQEMDSRYAEQRIIGWYHSHPDFGIFLSERDCFIQENFFSGPGQIAYVVDPVRDLEGVFEWRSGKPEPVAHYWVGDRIIPVEASRKSTEPDEPARGPLAEPGAQQAGSGVRYQRPPLDVMTLLGWLSLFLLGYLIAGAQTRWQRERMIEGAVVHYGVNKVMRLGFEDQLRETRERLQLIDEEVTALLEVDQSELDDEQSNSFAERRQRVLQALALSRESLRNIEDTYGYTDLERSALARYRLIEQAMPSTNGEDESADQESATSTAVQESPARTTSDDAPPGDGEQTESSADPGGR